MPFVHVPAHASTQSTIELALVKRADMSHAAGLKQDHARGHDPVIDDMARDLSTSVDVVRALYEEEVAALAAQATLKQYIGIIAAKQVRQRLRRSRGRIGK